MDILYNSICESVLREEEVLSKIGRGVFLMQEIALVYSVARSLIDNSSSVFGSEISDLRTETNVKGRSGRVDLLIEIEDGRKLVFEFKTRSNAPNCLDDIEKLRKIDRGYEKYFCALVQVDNEKPFENDTSRVLSSLPDVQSISEKNIVNFETNNYQRKKLEKNVGCLIGLWKINES